MSMIHNKKEIKNTLGKAFLLLKIVGAILKVKFPKKLDLPKIRAAEE